MSLAHLRQQVKDIDNNLLQLTRLRSTLIKEIETIEENKRLELKTKESINKQAESEKQHVVDDYLNYINNFHKLIEKDIAKNKNHIAKQTFNYYHVKRREQNLSDFYKLLT